MVPSILLLPSELKQHIAELLVSSPDSLAALARTHTAYQREAEKALYHTISIYDYRKHSFKCMKTLTKNPEKAALVRFLAIQYTSAKFGVVTTYLSKSLINMHSLSDFRVRTNGVELEEEMVKLVKVLDKILWSFSITNSLYCPNIFNISQIIRSQTELQILGLYMPCSPEYILETLKELHSAQLFLPIVYILKSEGLMSVVHHICIFPAFYSVDRRAAIHQVLAQYFRQKYSSLADRVFILSIYSSDMPSIYALAKDMAVSFPEIRLLYLWFERRYEIPPLEIFEEFSFFSNLRYISNEVWPTA